MITFSLDEDLNEVSLYILERDITIVDNLMSNSRFIKFMKTLPDLKYNEQVIEVLSKTVEFIRANNILSWLRETYRLIYE